MDSTVSGPDFTLRAAPGAFVPGLDRDEDAPRYAPHLGLLPGQSWRQVRDQVKRKKEKLVIFLRHGEATHNADKTRVGDSEWEARYKYSTDYIDAPLTAKGVQQAREAGRMLHDELEHHDLSVDLVVVSPLDRTLQTYANVFAHVNVDAPVEVHELARETLGVCPCDQRGPMAPKREEYPAIDFANVSDEDDTWWMSDHRETDAEMEERARKFLHHLMYERPEHTIAVVTHSGFTRGCLRALGHRFYRPANGEFVPVIIQVAGDDAK